MAPEVSPAEIRRGGRPTGVGGTDTPETLRGLLTGDRNARRACEEFQRTRTARMVWAACVAPVLLTAFYGLLVFRPRRTPPASVAR